MFTFDAMITRFVNAPAGQKPFLDQIAVLVSEFSLPVLVALVAVQWWRQAERLFVRHVLVASGLSFFLGLGLNHLVLLFVHRIRPYDAGVSHLLIAPSADWSMPSDHATASMAIAATFLVNRMYGKGLFFLAASMILMFSRVYVGIHYAGDVLAGALTGLLAALLVWKLYREGSRIDRMITGIF